MRLSSTVMLANSSMFWNERATPTRGDLVRPPPRQLVLSTGGAVEQDAFRAAAGRGR